MEAGGGDRPSLAALAMQAIGGGEHAFAQRQGFGPAQPHLGQGRGGGDQVVLAGAHGRGSGRIDRLLAQSIGSAEELDQFIPSDGGKLGMALGQQLAGN